MLQYGLHVGRIGRFFYFVYERMVVCRNLYYSTMFKEVKYSVLHRLLREYGTFRSHKWRRMYLTAFVTTTWNHRLHIFPNLVFFACDSLKTFHEEQLYLFHTQRVETHRGGRLPMTVKSLTMISLILQRSTISLFCPL